MSELRKQLDNALGGPFKRDIDYVPGVITRDWEEVIYFQDDQSDLDYWKQLTKITESGMSVPVKGGAILGSSCQIKLPDQSRFFCVSFWKDLPGWRCRIMKGAEILKVPLAKIEKELIVVNDGRIVELSRSKISFSLVVSKGVEKRVSWPE
jgi:hypothetical protein